jgi:hypothetical protein
MRSDGRTTRFRHLEVVTGERFELGMVTVPIILATQEVQMGRISI